LLLSQDSAVLASCFVQWNLTPESVVAPLASAILASEGLLPADTVLELLWCMSKLQPGNDAVFRRLVDAALLRLGDGDVCAADWTYVTELAFCLAAAESAEVAQPFFQRLATELSKDVSAV